MGNTSNFNKPPSDYIFEIGKQRKREAWPFADEIQDEYESNGGIIIVPETTNKSNSKAVKEFIINTTIFLDKFTISHVTASRIKNWLTEKHSVEEKGRKVSEIEDDVESTPTNIVKELNPNERQRQLQILTRKALLFPYDSDKKEVKALIKRSKKLIPPEDIESHLFAPSEIENDEINVVFLYMVQELFGKHVFPMENLCHFLTTLRRNYNNVGYHNYHHALSHAQSMYWILRQNPTIFTELEMMTLMISSLAHDTGHFGLNEHYLKKTDCMLTKMYPTPLLENHHAQTTLLILMDLENNVFCDLSSEEYQMVMEDINHCILSTCVDSYKDQTSRFRELIDNGFDLRNKNLRNSLKEMLMMICDLSSSWKTWEVHMYTVNDLYYEFCKQGDIESRFNLDSQEEMKRKNQNNLPKYQVSFLETSMIPMFKTICRVLPNLQEIVNCTSQNVKLWKIYQKKS